MDYPKTITDLIACFKKLPGVGEKTAERYALSILNSDLEFTDMFSDTLRNVKTKIKRCSICNNYSEETEAGPQSCHLIWQFSLRPRTCHDFHGAGSSAREVPQ